MASNQLDNLEKLETTVNVEESDKKEKITEEEKRPAYSRTEASHFYL